MLSLIIGGSASGKSEYAERHVCALNGQRIYIATMQPWDDECLKRIEKHRLARKDRGFETREKYRMIENLIVNEGENLLLEDLPNLVANELFGKDRRTREEILDGILVFARHCKHLTIVTGEVFSGGQTYEGETLEYLKVLAYLNRKIAQQADLVVEVTCGLPNVLKGETYAIL